MDTIIETQQQASVCLVFLVRSMNFAALAPDFVPRVSPRSGGIRSLDDWSGFQHGAHAVQKPIDFPTPRGVVCVTEPGPRSKVTDIIRRLTKSERRRKCNSATNLHREVNNRRRRAALDLVSQLS
jgi:hypothetical protein